jgi:antitoxin (DNA-binding transcriptional repressor) of toxin-antitoxin stability system
MRMFRIIRTMAPSLLDRRARSAGPTVSATEAAKNFGRLVDRVREEETVYLIERGGTPVAQIGPVTRAVPFTLGHLKALALSLARPDERYLAAVEQAMSRHARSRARRNPWER